VTLRIAQESPRQDEVGALLRASDAHFAALYPAESNHLVDVDALAAANVRFVVARIDGRAVGCGAVLLGEDGQGELKRMFVDPAARGRGVGRAILAAVEEIARAEGMRQLQLETGVDGPDALGLYRGAGYCERGPFGSYQPDLLFVFMEKQLDRS
jgi:putative acetyltransferase